MSAAFEDSNVANLGSKENHSLRQNAAHKEHAWTNAGQKAGTQVWRIEKFQVHDWPVEKYGQFYSGDAYIVLRTYQPDPKSEKLAWNVHFWLGKASSQDEQGTAAYKTVELDDFLNDAPVQYREVQSFESELFGKLFPHLIYLDGGIDSGFHHEKAQEYKPRLLHLHGDRKHVSLSQVPLSLDSLDDGDVYILDDGLTLYQWNGTKSNPAEKRKADAVIHAIVDERHGKPKHTVVDGLENNADFWKYFGGKPAKIDADKTTVVDRKIATVVMKLSDESGSLTLTKVGEGKVKKDVLNNDDVFIVDTGVELFVYVGSKASKDEKSNAINYATAYLKKEGKGREMNTPISRVIQGTESKEFDAAFSN